MISVIVPVYNASKFLRVAIDSVLNQTYSNFELILINDGSTDNSKEICEEYKKQDGRVKALHTENKGPSEARNAGIDQSSGDLLFFLDADDYIEPQALQSLYEKQKLYNSEFTICDFIKLCNTDKLSSGHRSVFQEDCLLNQESILSYVNDYLATPNKNPLLTQSWGRLFQRSIIVDHGIRFNADLRTFEDVEFNFKYLQYVNTLLFVNEPLYTLRVHTDHFSATMKLVETPDSLFGYRSALRQAALFLREKQTGKSFEVNLLKAYVTYSIIQLIRLSIQRSATNKQSIISFVKRLLQDPMLQRGLKQFTPRHGDSRLIPWLMRVRFTRLLLYICRRRGTKRYNT